MSHLPLQDHKVLLSTLLWHIGSFGSVFGLVKLASATTRQGQVHTSVAVLMWVVVQWACRYAHILQHGGQNLDPTLAAASSEAIAKLPGEFQRLARDPGAKYTALGGALAAGCRAIARIKLSNNGRSSNEKFLNSMEAVSCSCLPAQGPVAVDAACAGC